MFVDEALKALSNYPIVESAVALLVLLGGYKIMVMGKKDATPSTYSPHEYPLWLLTGPVHDAFLCLNTIREESQKQTVLLTDINRESRRQTQMLENIWNENVINPRRLQE